MIYVMSDLHGCYDLYRKMLRRIEFSKSDTLYVLGDVVDRGPDGLKILLDMSKRSNVVFLWGNHDYVALQLLCNLFEGGSSIPDEDLQFQLQVWTSDGGDTTLNKFLELSSRKRERIITYLLSGRIYAEIELNGKQYLLAHTVPEMEKMHDFINCTLDDFILGEPEYEKLYFEDKYIVTGHTPTWLIDEAYAGQIYEKNNHIAVDCGAVFNGVLGCIRLDDMKAFYVEKKYRH